MAQLGLLAAAILLLVAQAAVEQRRPEVALAPGLVASRVVAPLAGSSGRASLKRGRIGPALTAFGLERRPAMRKVVTVVGVAVALTVFAANALVVANRNWTQRAQSETGA